MKNLTDFEDILKEKYGEKGSPARDRFDADSLAFSPGIVRRLVQQVPMSQDI